MIHAELDPRKGLLIVAPEGPLTAEDFRGVAAIVDPYIAERAVLRGLLVRAPTFPGWESFGALIEHMKFVHNHHRDIERVAAVTDSDFLRIAPAIARHFLRPRSASFPATRRPRRWLGFRPTPDAPPAPALGLTRLLRLGYHKSAAQYQAAQNTQARTTTAFGRVLWNTMFCIATPSTPSLATI